MRPEAVNRLDDRSSARARSGIPDLGATVRLGNWWTAKATNLLGVLYAVMLVTHLQPLRALQLLIPAVITIVGIGGFGHMLNDLYDVESDARVGKENGLIALSGRRRHTLLVALLAVALLPWLALPLDGWSVGLLAVEFTLLIAYAVPPLRLKGRRVWAVLADAAYAYSIPAILAAHTFFLASGRTDERWWLGSLALWQLALGVRHFLNHLALDRNNDLASHTPTLATQKGNRFIHRLIRHIVLPVELTAWLTYLLLLGRAQPWLPVSIAGIVLLTSTLQGLLLWGRGYWSVPYRFSRSRVDWLYQDVLPLVLLGFLVAGDLRYLLLLAAHLILFRASAVRAATAGLGALALAELYSPRWRFLRPSAAPLLTMRGTQPSTSARGGAQTVTPALPPIRNAPHSIALVNVHRGKYTETFIDALIPRLKYNVYRLHGGELPTLDDDNHHLLFNSDTLRSFTERLTVGLGLERDRFLRSSICSYLQAKDVRLILAEFGPVGVQMRSLARDLGIPLIVQFHGYDVFDQRSLERYGPHYPALFADAARIVGVSEFMLDRLEALGAPRSKLVHLPAFVDLDKFPWAEHAAAPPRFLAVGRFCETKSPHLTLLAFHRVAQAMPNATLTLIGKGGGGELFEACLILAKSLGLEQRVAFLGVQTHEEVAAEMRRARVFVQHSVTTPARGDMEGKPVAIMEAMACGLPVVATRHPGISELIESEVTGLLVDEFDVEGMAAAMVRLASDDGLARRLGRNASQAIHAHPLVSRHIAILEELIDTSIAAG